MSKKHSVLKPLALCALLGLSASAFAEVKINIPGDVDFLAANNQKQKLEGGFLSSSRAVTLPDGQNQIVFRYEPVFKQGDTQKTVNTDVIIAKFDSSDSELTLVMPKYSREKDAEQFNDHPESWKLVDQDGNQVDVVQDVLKKDGFQIGRKYDQESIVYNQSNGVAAVPITGAAVATATAINMTNGGTAYVPATAVPATHAAAEATIQQPVSAQYKTTEEQMLHYWYEKADPETKQRFLQSIIQAK
ncbi:MAG: DUF2057 family protein [Vibrio sp.]